jgi:hypothetical protein
MSDEIQVQNLTEATSLTGDDLLLVIQGGIAKKLKASTNKAFSIADLASADITDFDTAVNALIDAATIDAATLQGQNGAYYLNRDNHTGTQLANTISDFNAAAIAATLTGFSAEAGTVSATDTILQAINKIVGNQAAGGGVTSITGTANQVNVSASTGNVTLSLPQSIAVASTPTFGQMTISSNTGLKMSFIDGPASLHGYQAWYLSDGVTRKGYLGFPAPGSATLTMLSEIGGTSFGAKVGNTHDFQINNASIFTISASAIAAAAKIAANDGIDLGSYSGTPVAGSLRYNSGLEVYDGAAWQTPGSGTLPSWANTYTANAGRDLYFRAQNPQVNTCYTGYMIDTGVYNQYTIPTNFTTAPWFFGLYQDLTADNDKCGIAQYGVGHYVTVYRRDQVALGLDMAFEPRGITAGHNRDDLHVLMKNNAMIKGANPELFFYNTSPPSANMQNASIKQNDQGICFYGYNSNWDSPALAMSIFTNPSGQEISAFAQIFANAGITIGVSAAAGLGAMKVSGTSLLFHDGTAWKTVQVV